MLRASGRAGEASRPRTYTPTYAVGYALYTVLGTWGMIAILRWLRSEEKKS